MIVFRNKKQNHDQIQLTIIIIKIKIEERSLEQTCSMRCVPTLRTCVTFFLSEDPITQYSGIFKVILAWSRQCTQITVERSSKMRTYSTHKIRLKLT